MRLGDNNFANLFARLISATNPDRDRDGWQVAGVDWRRQRHVFWAALSYQIEIHELQHRAKPHWHFVYVHEIWWGADRRDAIRNAHWVRLEKGERRDVLKWFTERQGELDNR